MSYTQTIADETEECRKDNYRRDQEDKLWKEVQLGEETFVKYVSMKHDHKNRGK